MSGGRLLSARLSGQLSLGALLAGEQMSIGGADSVRGFSQGEFIGDSGVQVNVEYGHSLPALADDLHLEDLRAVAFIDHGSVFVYRPEPGEDGSYHATGMGIGARAELKHNMSIRIDLGYAVLGKPQDGGRLKPCVQFVWRF
jgi:hemolysin activation/secretion protein